MEELPTQADIDLWKYGDDNEDSMTVCRMLDLSEDAEELEEAEDLEDGHGTYGCLAKS